MLLLFDCILLIFYGMFAMLIVGKYSFSSVPYLCRIFSPYI